VSKARFVTVADQNLLVVVTKIDRTQTTPAGTAVVGTDTEMAFGVQQARQRVRFGIAQPGGSSQAGVYRGLTAGAPCHQAFSVEAP
jgi:hypothetical protein